MTKEYLDMIEVALHQATPGPWVANGPCIYGPEHPASKHPNGRVFIARVSEGSNRRHPYLFGGCGGDMPMPGSSEADARLILLAIEALPRLITALREVGIPEPEATE